MVGGRGWSGVEEWRARGEGGERKMIEAESGCSSHTRLAASLPPPLLHSLLLPVHRILTSP